MIASVGILFLAGLLRFHGLGVDSFWHDEIWSLEMSQGRDARQLMLPRTGLLLHPPSLTALDDAAPALQVWTHMRLDNHPPLYVLLLRLWRDCFGSSETAVRTMSALASLIAIIALFDAARLTVGTHAALWACLLMAVAVPQLQYAQEARDYAVLLAEGMLACEAIIRLRYGGRALWAALLGVMVCAMALTHYFAAGALVALAAFAVVQPRGRARRAMVTALLAAALMGALLWGHEFWLQRGNFGGQRVAWLREPGGHPAIATAARALLLPARYVFDAEGKFRIAGLVVAAAYVLPLFALRRRPGLLLWWLWLACTVGVVGGLDLAAGTRELAQVRYTLLAAPALYVLIAAAGQWVGRGGRVSVWAGRLVPLSALAVCLVWIPRAYHPDWRPNWRGLGQAIEAHRAPDELLCCVGPGGDDNWLWNTDELYAPLTYYLHPLPAPIALLRDVPPQAANAADDVQRGPVQQLSLSGYPGVWAIVSGATHQIAWPPSGWTIVESTGFHGIGALQHLRPTPPPPQR